MDIQVKNYYLRILKLVGMRVKYVELRIIKLKSSNMLHQNNCDLRCKDFIFFIQSKYIMWENKFGWYRNLLPSPLPKKDLNLTFY